jgi:transketolase
MKKEKEKEKDLLFYLKNISSKIRQETIKLAYEAEYAHPGPSLSVTDLLVALYYSELNINSNKPNWEERDRFILSKGHGCLSLYAILADLNFYSKRENLKLRKLNSLIQGHPDMRKTPGIDFTTGSLGNGIGAAVGIAISFKMDRKQSRIFTILGDGENQEGVVWEAASIASHFKLDNLIVIIDNNNFQSSGPIEEISNIYPIRNKWEAFGWKVIEIDGHNFKEILLAFKIATSTISKPITIIAHTIKGKGISFMENDNSWHQRQLTKEQYQLALNELSSYKESEKNG